MTGARPRCAALLAVIVVGLGLGGRGVTPAAATDPYDAEVVLTSADLAQRLTRMPDVEFGTSTVHGEPVINVNAGVRYQDVNGFGAAMTDTSAWLIERRTSTSA